MFLCWIPFLGLLVLTHQQDFISEDKFRLPDNTVPLHYNLHLETRVDQQNFTYTGYVDILIKVVHWATAITLHAVPEDSMRITKATLISNQINDEEMEIGLPTYFDEKVVFGLISGELVPKNRYRLKIHFTNILKSTSFGFFRGRYSVNGKNR